MKRNRITLIIKLSTLAICLLFLFLHFLYIKPWTLDDAFISFRYAKNFAEGHGLVFNPNEPPVEGYTNFLWIMILAIGYKTGLGIVVFSKILGYLCSVGTVILILFYEWGKKISPHIQVLAAIILSSSGIFTVWGSSGMETSLFTFLLTLSLLLFLKITQHNPEKASGKKVLYLSVLLSLLALTRPEGYLVFIILGLLFLTFQIITNKRLAIKSLMCYTLPFLIVVVVQLTFRLLYYQDILPNTFYNKVGSGIDQYLRGIRYTKDFVVANSVTILFTCVYFLSKRKKKKNNNLLPISLAVLGIYATYIIYIGGDVMPAFRFFSPLFPLVAILASLGVDRTIDFFTKKLGYSLKKQFKLFLYSFIGATLITANLFMWKYDREIGIHLKSDCVAEAGKESGLWLKNNFSSDTLIATNAAGAIPFYSELKTIDMLGLNDRHIAKRDMPDMGKGFPGHEKTDGIYILSQNPDIIIFASSTGSSKPLFVSDKEVYEILEFQEKYELVEISLDSGRIFRFYRRK
ncbi:MAG: hypothetical protein PHS44_01665 [Candidatus Dojkabacteria bacterium]|nr:hypothetical protein [Candidatus Dojkabacteria bacterium]